MKLKLENYQSGLKNTVKQLVELRKINPVEYCKTVSIYTSMGFVQYIKNNPAMLKQIKNLIIEESLDNQKIFIELNI